MSGETAKLLKTLKSSKRNELHDLNSTATGASPLERATCLTRSRQKLARGWYINEQFRKAVHRQAFWGIKWLIRSWDG